METNHLPLVCLPFGGSGGGFYRQWAKDDGCDLSILPIQLPGREEKLLDEPYHDITHAAADLAGEVVEATDGLDRYALFGHSLGAVLSYELARALTARGETRLAHLYVSGSSAPWRGRSERATGLADDEFIERVQEFAGYRHSAFDDPELRELLLPALRADVAMHENYDPVLGEPLTLPVTSLRGAGDTLVSAAEAGEWRRATTGRFEYVEVPGGHMYLVDHPEAVWRTVAGR